MLRQTRRGMKNMRMLLVAALAALVLAPAALAAGGGAAANGYGGAGGNVQSNVGSNGALGTQAKTASGGLPFTGVDLGLLVAGAVVLLAVGAGLRRAAAANKS